MNLNEILVSSVLYIRSDLTNINELKSKLNASTHIPIFSNFPCQVSIHNQSIQDYYENAKTLISNIQKINQVISNKHMDLNQYVSLNSEQCDDLINVTDEEIRQNHPTSRQFLPEVIIQKSSRYES